MRASDALGEMSTRWASGLFHVVLGRRCRSKAGVCVCVCVCGGRTWTCRCGGVSIAGMCGCSMNAVSHCRRAGRVGAGGSVLLFGVSSAFEVGRPALAGGASGPLMPRSCKSGPLRYDVLAFCIISRLQLHASSTISPSLLSLMSLMSLMSLNILAT